MRRRNGGFPCCAIPWAVFLRLILNMVSFMPISGAPNFGCASQLDQHLFWRASNYTSPPVLVKAMKEYEEYHSNCRKQEAEYESDEDFGRALMGRGKNPLACQYLVWYSPFDGLGNRLLSLVSTYVLAILTKRVLVLDRQWPVEKLFCEPFLGSSWLLPLPVRTDLMFAEAKLWNEWVTDGVKARAGKDVIASPHAVKVVVNHDDNIKFFCPSELERLKEVQVLLILSNQYYVPGLYYTKYRTRIEELFPDRLIFTPTGRKILNPTKKIWERASEVFYRYLKPAGHRLGLQLRTKEQPWRREKSARLDKCAQRLGLLPPPLDRKSKGGVVFSRLPDTATFVASLKRDFYFHLKNAYVVNPREQARRVSVHRATHASEQLSSDLSHNEDAIIDMWLLSFSDDLMVSRSSTFGYISSALMGKSPIFLNGLLFNEEEEKNQNSEDCSFAVTPEPCFHQPPWKVECPSDPAFEDPWHQEPSLRQCDDWERGVQVAPLKGVTEKSMGW